MSLPQRMDPKTAQNELTDHPHYRYRGCAPDVDDPRMSAGDPALPVTSWEAPDVDGGEPQPVRVARERAAIEVCVDCPVMVQCLAYGSSVTRGGKLAEPHAILGGLTALERRRAFEKTRQDRVVRPVPGRQLRTPQKLAVLKSLAVHTDPWAVAAAAGMDLRTANWQRSILVNKLGLDHAATRRELLRAAAACGLLNGIRVVADDGSVPAVPPPAKSAAAGGSCARQTGLAAASRRANPPAPRTQGVVRPAGRARSSHGPRLTVLPGQLSLLSVDDLTPSATVTELPTHTRLMEAAA